MEIKEKVTRMRETIEKKKGLAVLLGILIILFSAAFIFNAARDTSPLSPPPEPQTAQAGSPPEANDSAQSAAEDEKAEVLPQTERLDEASGLHPPDPFATPPRLTGVFLGGDGEDLAIIEVGEDAYIKTKGETVAELWQVSEISRHTVTLVSGNNETLLYLGR